MAEKTTDFGSIEKNSFFAGTEIPALTTSITLASGQGVLTKGALIGVVTTGGAGKLVDTASADGSEVAKYVLATEEIDTDTDTELGVVVYKTGIFNYDALYVADGDTVEAHADELRENDIHYRTDY